MSEKEKSDESHEPQSYGSQQEWVSGRTGQQVNDQKSSASTDPDFYDSDLEARKNGRKKDDRGLPGR